MSPAPSGPGHFPDGRPRIQGAVPASWLAFIRPQDAAAAAAASVAQAWQANAGQGRFTSAGKPEAVAGAQAKPVGFGTPIDETEWIANTVTHDVIPDVGWDTTVETEVQPY